MRIILDTNFLMIPGTQKVDIFAELSSQVPNPEFVTITNVVKELENLENTAKKGKDKSAAKLALQLVKNKNIKILETETLKNTDNLIVKIAKSGDYGVATQDNGLKVKLKESGVPLFILRQKRRVIAH